MDMNKTSRELVVDLINITNNRTFDGSEFTFEAPTLISGDRNSSVRINAVPGSKYFGSKLLRYNRMLLSKPFTDSDPDAVVYLPNDGYLNSTELYDRLNAQYGLKLAAEDLALEPLNISTLPFDYILNASPNSLAWMGGVKLQFQQGRPLYRDTFQAGPLNGFTFPDGDVSGLTAPQVDQNESVSFADGNGNLLYGTSVPAAGFNLCFNGELEIGACARKNGATTIVPMDADGTFVLQLTSETSWSVPVSLGFLNDGDDEITTTYDVSIEIVCPDASVLKLKLVRDGSNYRFVNTALNIVLDDDYVNGDGSIYQSIVDMRTLKPYLGTVLSSAAGAPLGIYQIRLMARRRNSIAPRELVTFLVQAVNN